MLKSSKRFVLLNNDLNEDGFRVIISGCDISFFRNNPQLYWMLDCFGMRLGDNVLVKSYWDEIQVNNKEISAVPVFNDNDPFAVKIFHKVEHGTIKAVNVVIDYLDFDSNPGNWIKGQTGPTVLKSKITKVSLSIGNILEKEKVTTSDAPNNIICLKSIQPKTATNLSYLFSTPSYNTPTNTMDNKQEKKPGFAESEHSPATKAVLKNAVAVGKLKQDFADELANMTPPEDLNKIAIMYDAVKRAKIKPERASVNYHPGLMKQAANKTYDEISNSGDTQLRNMRVDAPELYKAKFFEKFGRMPGDAA